MVAFIGNRQELEKLIQQEPLIATGPSLEGSAALEVPASLYFGIGLCNRNKLSEGLPIDVLSMLLIGEHVGKEKVILIADSHAKTNGFEAQSIDRLAAQNKERLQRAIEKLGLSQWQVMRASEIDQTPTYRDILSSVEASHDYVRRELADIRWFNLEHGINLKVGWALNGSKNADERAFDEAFRYQFQEPLAFIYVVPGRTFDPKQPCSAPYLCTNPKARILLEADENVSRKLASAQEQFGQQPMREYEKFLKQLVRLYDKTMERTERGPLSNRLQQVIDRCTK